MQDAHSPFAKNLRLVMLFNKPGGFMKKSLYLLTFLILTVAFPAVHLMADKAKNREPAKLVLSAQATLSKPSDELQLKIGVVTLGNTAEETCSENNVKMQAVIAGLEAAGLVKGDYETGQFSIQPTYTPYPKDASPNWQPSINGYEVSNYLLVHTEKLELTGTLIDVANKAGANSLSDIRFGLKDPRLYWNEALTAASNNAVSDAKALAAATGVRLVRVLSITLDSTRVHSPQVNAAYLVKAVGGGDSTPIEPGEVTITAHVTLTYEISSDK